MASCGVERPSSQPHQNLTTSSHTHRVVARELHDVDDWGLFLVRGDNPVGADGVIIVHAARIRVEDEVEAALDLLRIGPRLLLVREREEERALVIVPWLPPEDGVGGAISLQIVPGGGVRKGELG